MVNLDDAVIARYSSHGEHFEIFVDPEKTGDIKSGDRDKIMDSVVTDVVFKDARKGLRASEEALEKIFETLDFFEIAKKIVMEGDIHLTTEQRRHRMDEKKKMIIAIIAREAINPQTKTPHPPARIEMAMEEAKVKVDPFRDAEKQVKEVLEKISVLIPIRFEKMRMALRTNAANAGKIYGDVLHFGKIIKEEYTNTGMWLALVEIPAGIQIDFLDRINSKIHGDIETKIVK